MHYCGRSPDQPQISLQKVFTHYSRTTDLSLERGYKLVYLANGIRMYNAPLARMLQTLGQEIIEQTERSRGELLLLYSTQGGAGIPAILPAPKGMFDLI